MENTNKTWVYHPSGLKVEITFSGNATEALATIDEYLAAGFLVTAPEVNADTKLEVRFVVRGQKQGDDGTLTDRLYFYKDWGMEGSDMTHYLDDPEDVTKFERASGLTVSTMPIWKSKAAPAKTSSDFDRYAKRVNFTVNREKQKSKKYPDGRWVITDYVWSGSPQKPSTTPVIQFQDSKTVESSQASENGENGGGDDNKWLAYKKAKAWAEGKGYNLALVPYPMNKDSEDVAKKWCADIANANAKVKAQ